MKRQPQTHWRCPDCFVGCRCEGAARELPHTRCGHAGPLTIRERDVAERRAVEAYEEGIRQAYEAWRERHASP